MLAQRHVHAAVPRSTLFANPRDASSRRTKSAAAAAIKAATRGSTASEDDQPSSFETKDEASALQGERPAGPSSAVVGRRQAVQGLALSSIASSVAAAASPALAAIEPLAASQREYFLRAPALFYPFYGKGGGKATLRKEIVPGCVFLFFF